MIIDVISILSTFIVALLGIMGLKKIDTSQRGLKKVTPVGYILILIAVIALVLSVYQARKKHEMASTKAMIANMAHSAILYQINENILLPALTLTDEIAGGNSEVNVLRFYKDLNYMRQFMEEHFENQFDLSHIKLNEKPRNVKVGLAHQDMAWWEIFEHDFSVARIEINSILARYAAYMEPTVLLSTSQLVQSGAIQSYLEEVPTLMKKIDKNGRYPTITAELIQAYLFEPGKPSLFDNVSRVKSLIITGADEYAILNNAN